MTPDREQAVGARMREMRMAAGLTLIEAESESGVSKSTISEIELTPAGAELPPSADKYCEYMGYRLVRLYRYELRRLPGADLRGDSSRASRKPASMASKASPRDRRRARPTPSSSKATASRVATSGRSGKQRTTSSRR